MLNEDIVTALKNAVDRGESLDSAIQMMINSGYESKEVQEASHFISRGVSTVFEPKYDEHLTMPQHKGTYLNNKPKQIQPFQSVQQSMQQPVINVKEPAKKSSYLLEILLLIVLLVLVGALIAIFIYKDEILKFFS